MSLRIVCCIISFRLGASALVLLPPRVLNATPFTEGVCVELRQIIAVLLDYVRMLATPLADTIFEFRLGPDCD